MEEIARILPKVFRKGPLGRTRPVLEVLVPLWPRVAGKFIAQHSLPVGFREGVLTLAAPSPAWAAQLRQMSEPLRAHVNNFLGAPVVKRLYVRQQGLPSRAPEAAPEAPRAPSAIHVPWTEADARLNPEIARIVETSFAKYFSRRPRSVN